MTHNKMNIPNRLSIMRIVLVPFFIGSIVYSRMDIAFIFFFIAVISDGLDGFIARATNQKTHLGTILDPIADKLLLMSAFICLSVATTIPAHLRLPPYVPIVVISRDAMIVLGSIVIHLITGSVKIEPSVIGKITTFFQMMTIVSILLKFEYSFIVWNIATVLTVVSGIDYMIKGSRVFNGAHSAPRKTE